MSRRKAAPKRTILPDPLFDSKVVSKFINCVMRSGKKSIAEKIVYGALIRVQQKESGHESKDMKVGLELSNDARQSAIQLFEKALDNISPRVEVKSRRVGGSTYQVPVEVRPDRRVALAMRWLVDYAKTRNERTMEMRLANEISDAIHSRGGAYKKFLDVLRMAEANRAFAHYRW